MASGDNVLEDQKPLLGTSEDEKYRATGKMSSAGDNAEAATPSPTETKATHPTEQHAEESPPPVPFSRLLRFSTPWERVLLFAGLVAGLGSSVTQPIGHWVLGDFTKVMVDFGAASLNASTANATVSDHELGAFLAGIRRYGAYSAALGIVDYSLNYASLAIFKRVSNSQIYRIRDLYLKSLLRQDIGWHDMQRTGDLASRMSEDLSEVDYGLGEAVTSLAMLVVGHGGALVVAAWRGWELAAVCLVALPFAFASLRAADAYTAGLYSQEAEARGSANAQAEEALSAIRTVVAFGGQQKEVERFSEKLEDVEKLARKRNLANGVYSGVLSFSECIMYALASWYGVYLILRDREYPESQRNYDAATVITVFYSVTHGSTLFSTLSSHMETISEARGAGAKLFSIIDRKSAIDSLSEEGEKPYYARGDVTFKNVHFEYPSRKGIKILQGLNLKIKAGETVALVGSSGCGKSTCMQLIQRFYDPGQGTVELDGRDLRTLNVGWLRSQIGVVGQEPVLFQTSIAENIRYGREGCTMEEIEEAAKIANAHGFISKLPKDGNIVKKLEARCSKANAATAQLRSTLVCKKGGYDTMVGERGAQLSGGQKQRIAIARALVRRPNILLLDEATSALDTSSEAQVQQALDRASTGRTTIIVAHRLSTVRNADRIIVVSGGVVVEEGSHDQLMARRSHYHALVTAQLSAAVPDHQEKVERPRVECTLSDHSDASSEDEEREAEASAAGEDAVDQEEQVVDQEEEAVDQEEEAVDQEEEAVDQEEEAVDQEEEAVDQEEEAVDQEEEAVDQEEEAVDQEEEAVDQEEEALDQEEAGLWAVLRLSVPDWRIAITSLLLSTLSSFVGSAVTVVFADVIGAFSLSDATEMRTQARWFGVTFLAIAVVSATIQFLESYDPRLSGAKQRNRIRSLMFSAMLRQEMAWFDSKNNSTGALCARLSGGAYDVDTVSVECIGHILNQVATLLLSVGLCVYHEWRMGLVVVAFLPVKVALNYYRDGKIQEDMTRGWEAMEKASEVAVETVGNIRTVAGLGCERRFHQQYMSQLRAALEMEERSEHLNVAFNIVYGNISTLSHTVCLYYGATLVHSEGLPFKDVFKVSDALNNVSGNLLSIPSYVQSFRKGLVGASKLLHLLNRQLKVADPHSTAEDKWESKGEVSYRGVEFRYPSRPEALVLKGVDLEVRPGQTVALVGASGGGKSTCVQLLLRFYDPNRGTVALDERDISSIRLSSLRAQLGMVQQEPVLFNRTIAENIAYGDNSREVTMEEIINVAKKANIHDFVETLPQGYETLVGEKGIQLSGGQKQRVAIARALVRNPPVLLLDEATSALDAESEKVVQEALDNARDGRTCITIAHRLSTVQDADLICVISNGKVVERGKHANLLAKRGFYYKLQSLQLN